MKGHSVGSSRNWITVARQTWLSDEPFALCSWFAPAPLSGCDGFYLRKGLESVDWEGDGSVDSMRWREHRGADCPIDPKAEVVICFRNGRENGPLACKRLALEGVARR